MSKKVNNSVAYKHPVNVQPTQKEPNKLEELLIADKTKIKNQEIKSKAKYKALFFSTLVFTILLIGVAGFFVYNLLINIRELRKQKKKDENIYGDQQIRIQTLEDENKKLLEEVVKLKDDIAQKNYSEELLKKKIETLTEEKDKYKKDYTKLNSETTEKINKLFGENQQLRKELGKDLEEELKKSQKESPYPDKTNFILLCPRCPESVPLLNISEQDGEIIVNVKCEDCEYEESFELNEFLSKIRQINNARDHYCEKSDKSHSHIKASYFYSGKYYCKECATDLMKFVENKDIKEMEQGVIYTEEKYKYYCPECQKHYEMGFEIEEHNPNHKVIDLEELNNEIDINNYTTIVEEAENYIDEDLGDIKKRVIKSLPELMSEVNKMLGIYQNKIDALLYLGKIVQYSYERNKSYPNYFIIQNMLNFSNLIINNFLLKNLLPYNQGGISVKNIGKLFNELEEKLIN